MKNKELIDILKTMDLPEKRRDIYAPGNIAWLSRNIRFRNSNHPKIEEAVKFIKELMRCTTKS
jgi:hypothetical protein